MQAFIKTFFEKTVRFVAFTLEGPPYFSTDLMGSWQYATNCKSRNEKIDFMVCLEMLGCASKKIRQDIPPVFNGDKFSPAADFLAVTSLTSCSRYVYQWKKMYNEHARKQIYDMVGPASISGIDFSDSDHRSFIKNGNTAIMISDTGFLSK